MKQCQDCKTTLNGHGTPLRCKRCAARARYIARHGSPPEMLVTRCETCGLKFRDYASNHKKSIHGVYFCSPACRAAWVAVHNSIVRGGDGSKASKAEKDAVHYMKTAAARREKMNQRYRENRLTILAGKREQTLALKLEVVAAYGGKCVCCGEIHYEFLTVDHVNGDGAAHRLQVGKGRRIYADLKRRGFPKDGYRLLCFNCNIALGFYGYCPHRPDERRPTNHRPHKPGRKRAVK